MEQNIEDRYGDYLFVGANIQEGNIDKTDEFIKEKRWQHFFPEPKKEIKNIKVGTKIAIKAIGGTNQITIKAIGTVTENKGDGINLGVDLKKLNYKKTVVGYGGNLFTTIALYNYKETDNKNRELIDFTFYSDKEKLVAKEKTNEEKLIEFIDKNIDRKSFQKKIKRADEQRKNFLKQFPLNNLPNISPEQYDKIGSKESFMYILERATQDICSCNMGTNGNKKIYDKEGVGLVINKDVRNVPINIGKSDSEIFKNFMNAYYDFVDKFDITNYNPSEYNWLNRMVKINLILMYKGPIITNIAKDDNARQILKYIGINTEKIEDNISLNIKLTNYLYEIKPNYKKVPLELISYCVFDYFEKYIKVKDNNMGDNKFSLNSILYGPPGTGKTYYTKRYAIAICEDEELDVIENEMEEKEIEDKYKEYVSNGRIEFITFHQSYSYEDFIEGIKPKIKSAEDENSGDIEYEIKPGIFKNICERARENNGNYVLIIDEINRGNISKIFGELITLIEENKRFGNKEQVEVRLPYAKEDDDLFSVPNNLYILGTMNTADRSIALMDTALRRRFEFIEMPPRSELLDDIIIGKVSIREMLDKMNQRIEVLYDREHQIGHAFFMPLKGLKPREAEKKLYSIFEKKIIPLLQEYFYEDYRKIQLILGDNNFVKVKDFDAKLFGNADEDEIPIDKTYEINKEALTNLENYLKIYSSNN